MREILFRGKRIDNGEWVEGNLVLSNDAQDDFKAIIIPQTNNGIFTKHTGFKNISCYLGFEEWYQVDESTLFQWTGLVDKNGVKIFEGDIVRDIDGTLLVCWDEEKAAFVIRLQEYPYETLYLEEMWEDNEVIGSIHDKAVEE